MVELIKSQLNIYAIKYTIVNKNNGFDGPGAFVFKNGDKALFVGYSGNINTYLHSDEFKGYTLVGYSSREEGVKYTHIEQYLTQNNFLAASLADWLRENLKPTENKEEFVESKWDIRDICENYEKADSEERYNIARDFSSRLREEKFESYSKQMTIDEAWGVEKTKVEDNKRIDNDSSDNLI